MTNGEITMSAPQQDYGMRDLSTSLIRFTNALAMFSMQQMQNAVGAVTDSQAVISNFCKALDSLSDSLSSQIDASKKSTLDSITRTGEQMVDRTIDAMNVQALDPRGVMDTTAEFMRKTTESMADMLRRPASNGSSEPQNAADILIAR
jgi:hypothetical protein